MWRRTGEGLVIRPLGMIVGKMVKDECAVCAVSAVSAVCRERRFIPTTLVTAAAQKLIEVHEIDINPELLTTRRVGKVLTRMRLTSQRASGRGSRGWVISLEDVMKWSGSYGLDPAEITGVDTAILYANGANGAHGANGANFNANILKGVL